MQPRPRPETRCMSLASVIGDGDRGPGRSPHGEGVAASLPHNPDRRDLGTPPSPSIDGAAGAV
jgi:hypothetical protein